MFWACGNETRINIETREKNVHTFESISKKVERYGLCSASEISWFYNLWEIFNEFDTIGRASLRAIHIGVGLHFG